ncbi:MAG TPA: hypothetical protein VD772_02625, partial [Anseongella sp.]|nr:hypothetical protein [Anseongella sp.]
GMKKGVDGVSSALTASPLGLFTQALQILPNLFGASGDKAGGFSQVMDQVNATINVFVDRAKVLVEAGKALFSGDFTTAADLAEKSYKGIGDEIAREVELTGQLSEARYKLERDEAKNIGTSKRLLNEMERLKNVRDNEFNSLEKRNKANEEAFAVEMKRQATLELLARRRLEMVNKDIQIAGGQTKASTELLRQLGEAEEALYDILEDSAGKQNELITNRYQLEQERLEKQKAREERAFTDRISRLEAEVIKAGENGRKKLELSEKLLAAQKARELDNTALTEGEKALIVAKYEADLKKLRTDYAAQTAAELKSIAEKNYQTELKILNNFITEQQR